MAGYLKEVNIKSDLPTVDEAMSRLKSQIRMGKVSGGGALKVIHGYGSSGKGGKIRRAFRTYLLSEKKCGRIREVIAGEDFSIFHEPTREAFRRCPALRGDGDLERYNNGITIIVF